jgi:hypothetical protein
MNQKRCCDRRLRAPRESLLHTFKSSAADVAELAQGILAFGYSGLNLFGGKIGLLKYVQIGINNLRNEPVRRLLNRLRVELKTYAPREAHRGARLFGSCTSQPEPHHLQ